MTIFCCGIEGSETPGDTKAYPIRAFLFRVHLRRCHPCGGGGGNFLGRLPYSLPQSEHQYMHVYDPLLVLSGGDRPLLQGTRLSREERHHDS